MGGHAFAGRASVPEFLFPLNALLPLEPLANAFFQGTAMTENYQKE
jgi:hypothetical protein